MFKQLFRRRRIKRQVKVLPRDLLMSYGRRDHYTREQVTASMRRNSLLGSGGYIAADVCHAYAMFCNREDFDSFQAQHSESMNFDELRAEISSVLYGSKTDFTFVSLENYTPPSASSSMQNHSDTSSFSGSSGFDGSDGGCG